METDKELTKRIVIDLVKELEKRLKRFPSFLLSEYDLQGFLYCELLKNQDLEETFSYRKEWGENFRIHLEYPRLFSKSGKLKTDGRCRYDIVILGHSSKSKFLNDDFKKKAVDVGFELKFLCNKKQEIVLDNFCYDLPAFDKTSSDWDYQELPEIGVLFLVNVQKDKLTEVHYLEDIVNKIRKKKGNVEYCEILLCYLECTKKGITNKAIIEYL